MATTVVHLHHAAPAKPAQGAACNGCGVCCALTTCPLARLRFLKRQGPCPALLWQADERRYRCGLLLTPARYWPRLPDRAQGWASRLAQRWIAAGQGCDCSAYVSDDA